MSASPRIIGIGNPCVDYISVVDKLPRPNQGAGIRDFSRQGGGVVPTAIVTAARLGAECGFIGVTGSCTNGRFIREDFTRHGVDISHSVTDEGKYSDFALILSDLETNGRSIVYRGGSIRRLTAADLDKEYLAAADFLHLAGHGEHERLAARWMKEAGKTVVYDASGYDPAQETFLSYIDVFIASEFYYGACFQGLGTYEDNCRAVLAKGPKTVVFTLGEKGSVGLSDQGFFHAPGYQVEVADTVGAGDVYHGAFLFGLAQGWEAERTARFANAAAALKIGAIGGRAGIPTCETVLAFMRDGTVNLEERRERVEFYRNLWMFEKPETRDRRAETGKT